MLTDSQLQTMRVVVVMSLPDSCAIKRNSPVSNGAGGFTDNWETVATVACRISPTGNQPEERVIAERISSRVSYTITLPALTDVKASDRLAVGSRAFEVVGVLSRSYEVSRRVVCTEVL